MIVVGEYKVLCFQLTTANQSEQIQQMSKVILDDLYQSEQKEYRQVVRDVEKKMKITQFIQFD